MINKISKLAKAFEEKLLKPVIFIEEKTGGNTDRDGWRNNSWWKQRLYRVERSIEGSDEEYIVVSCIYEPEKHIKECTVFRADRDGQIISWKELGGYKGLDPNIALESAGFKDNSNEEKPERFARKTSKYLSKIAQPASVQAPALDAKVQSEIKLNQLSNMWSNRLPGFMISATSWGTGSFKYKAGKATDKFTGHYTGLMFEVYIPRETTWADAKPVEPQIDSDIKYIFKDFPYPVSYNIIVVKQQETPTNTHATRGPPSTR